MSKSEHDNFDLDMNHYSVHDLLELFSLDSTASSDTIHKQTQQYIDNATKYNHIALKQFYIEAQHKLLHSYTKENAHHAVNTNYSKHSETTENVGNLYNVNSLEKSGPDFTHQKNTTVNQVDYYKGDKNPIFKNTYHSIVNIDSAFREEISTSQSLNTTSFKSTLTFALANVIEYSVYSIELPYAWYNFSSSYGNTSLIINHTIITISDGNYTTTDLVSTINTELSDNGFSDVTLTLNSTTNKITITNSSTTTDYSITFYDITDPIFINSLNDLHLGINLGFTLNKSITVSANSSLTATATIYIYGSKYLLLKINDYSLNRSSSGIIGTMFKDNKCDYPSYLSRDLPTTSIGNNSNSVNVVNDSLPKRLTQAKAYTINAILDGRSSNTNTNASALDMSSDIMMKIPIPDQTAVLTHPNKSYGETGGFLSNYKREFFGKVNIFKLHTELLDDKGRIINLNGQNWSYTLLVKHLYQL